ncbi:hypothetical protein I0P11_07725 [Acinetobacter baumannii]|uniref:Uncharacterized protein n=1 Tax=Acinetobacter tandoii DSM 14970 = CIP 107469 TaxID=1120927 RepID=R9AS50_9GAMM|nr:hypothetical protein [Acinetobacter tandoii]EOR05052.1 hypothetical protein I593_03136 [Acinetobacter tandoii DSM 14970 = CIP 107469]MBF9261028.1 hypothetical protein [Acinetobacter baumannii]
MKDMGVVEMNIERAKSKLLMLHEELDKLSYTDCENALGEIVINHVNEELVKLLKFLTP